MTSSTLSTLTDGQQCQLCGEVVPERKRPGGSRRRYCSDTHRKAASDLRRGVQRHLDFTPAAVALRPIGAPAHNPALGSKLKRSALRVLARLEQGPANRLELQAVGGNRYAARIAELRDSGMRILGPMKCPRHGIYEREPLGPNGIEVYRLTESA